MKKTLIISDLHLHNRFDNKLYYYIVNLLNSVDQVIINGDFWDYYICSFDEFVSSQWSVLFPLLKEKNAVYIYGNHDKESFTDKRVRFFSTQQEDMYTLKSGDKIFRIEHGHRIAPELDDTFPFLTKLFDSFYPYFYFFVIKDNWLPHLIHQRFVQPSQLKMEKKLRRYVKNNGEKDVDGYIFGHSHVFTHIPEEKFYNSGYFFGGEAHYTIIENGVVTPHIGHYW